MNNKTTLYSLALGLALSTQVFAQGPQGPGPSDEKDKHFQEHRGSDPFHKIDPETHKKIEAIHEKYFKDIANKHLDLKLKEIELKRLFLTDKIDQAKVETNLRESAALKADLNILRFHEYQEIKTAVGDKIHLPPFEIDSHHKHSDGQHRDFDHKGPEF